MTLVTLYYELLLGLYSVDNNKNRNSQRDLYLYKPNVSKLNLCMKIICVVYRYIISDVIGIWSCS